MKIKSHLRKGKAVRAYVKRRIPKGRKAWQKLTPQKAANILDNSLGMTRANWAHLNKIAGIKYRG